MADETPADARRELLLAMADDELVTGHRASHWTGVTPSIEEDLAFSTIAQDGINHADVWYQVLLAGAAGDGDAGTEPSRAEVDALGLGRPADGYRHAVLCERPPTDFAFTLARHWAHDHAGAVRLGVLADASDPDVAAVAARLLHEVRYHLEHADLWFRRLARARGEPRERFGAALADVLPAAAGLFEPPTGEGTALATGLLAEPHARQFARWAEGVVGAADAAGLAEVVPAAVRDGHLDAALAAAPEATGGRHGTHTADFTDDVWPEMTGLYRTFPGATW